MIFPSPHLPMLRGAALVAAACALLAAHGPVLADYKADIGFLKLQAELGGTLPTGAAVTVTQVEAAENLAGDYFPNPAEPQFAGKTLTAKSGASGHSNHATTVGQFFFGSGSSISPAVQTIDVFEANDWIGSGFLNRAIPLAPKVETRAIQNSSWVGTLDNGGLADVETLRRLDFAIQRDGFLAVIGTNNGGSLPQLLASSYNGISVGLSNGSHSYGTTTVDGTGRTKPEIVSPFSLTSYATPSVASAAALLRQNAPANARRPVTMKAILMAGATKAEFPGWSRTTTQPIDTIHGAGQLNVYNSHHILAAGQQAASASVSVRPRGWDLNTTTAGGRRYFFDIPAGNTAPRLSVLLTWNRVIADGPGVGWGNPTSDLADLSLRLHTATGFTVGTLVDASLSTVDNVEHIYRPTLAPGRYAIEVTSPTAGVEYGLAWYSVPTVSITATAPVANETGLTPATFIVTRGGETTSPLVVSYTIGGTATNGADYTTIPGTVTIPASGASATVPITPLADSLAEGDETITLTLSADPAYAIAAGTAAVTMKDLPFDAWRFERFTPAELANPAQRGTLSDYEQDGLVNLEEYALGLDPKTPDANGRPSPLIWTNGSLALVHKRIVSATDISYIVEVSNNLTTWNTGPGFTSVVQIIGNSLEESWTVVSLLAPDTGQRQFMRLKIVRQ